MSLWLLLAVNSVTLGGLLFLLSPGFSLIFGLMRIPNLTHGSFFMLGAYLGTSFLALGLHLWLAALASAAAMAAIGGGIDGLLVRPLGRQVASAGSVAPVALAIPAWMPTGCRLRSSSSSAVAPAACWVRGLEA